MSKSIELIDIQKLQFTDKKQAEESLLAFLQKYEDSSIVKVELQPKPESLNSMNGFVTYDNAERYFFKTHTEENEQLSEYYNASTLAQAGYPVITTKQITHRPGKQIVLYEIVTMPTLFDLVKEEEDRQAAISESGKKLVAAQEELDQKVADIYESTLKQISAEEHARAPIHQLFSHRLAESGRLGLFYRGKRFKINDADLNFDTIENMEWEINGVTYSETLAQIIQHSRSLLEPKAGPSIVGHGDAHNGNVFFNADKGQLLMFDPAFAGLHDPILDLTKPLFHNIFARWMYFPEQVNNEFELNCQLKGDRIVLRHSFLPSELRQSFLTSKIENVLKPILAELQRKGQLAADWKDYLKSSLFCCPFLTVNLFADFVENGTLAERYPPSIKLLGLAMAVELGSRQRTGSSPLADMISRIFA